MDKQLVETEQPINQEVVVHQEQHMLLIQTAVEKSLDISYLEKLMDLQERWERGNARKNFFVALSKFQSQIPKIPKNGIAHFGHKQGGGSTSYTFAKLGDIAEAIKPLLESNGLSYRYIQKIENTDNHASTRITVVCIITHAGGHQECTEMSGYPDQSGKKNAIQEKASTVSYLRRYTLTGALGITASDIEDDGHGSEGPEAEDKITQDQVKQLTQAAKMANKNLGDVCAKAQIKMITDLPAQRYEGAMNWLKKQAIPEAQHVTN